MLDTSGRYANVVGNPDRPKIPAGNRLAITPEQFGAAAKEFAANFGIWSVAETERTITLQFVGSLEPNNEGAKATYSLALAGDDMTFSITLPGQRVEVVEYRRAK
jgi:Lipocalin-like domain